MECVLRQVVPIGERELFVGEVVALHADESVLDENGRVDPGRIDAIAYSQAQYWSQDKKLGVHGYSQEVRGHVEACRQTVMSGWPPGSHRQPCPVSELLALCLQPGQGCSLTRGLA